MLGSPPTTVTKLVPRSNSFSINVSNSDSSWGVLDLSIPSEK
jgi:hypothetical protein